LNISLLGVSKVFDEASKKASLFELFYKKKFPNLLFLNILNPQLQKKILKKKKKNQ
jgi:hypothetical protein